MKTTVYIRSSRLILFVQFKDSTFTIPTAHQPIVIIPPKFLDEIKALPEHTLTFKEQVSERFLEKYTGLGITDTLVHAVKVGIAPVQRCHQR